MNSPSKSDVKMAQIQGSFTMHTPFWQHLGRCTSALQSFLVLLLKSQIVSSPPFHSSTSSKILWFLSENLFFIAVSYVQFRMTNSHGGAGDSTKLCTVTSYKKCLETTSKSAWSEELVHGDAQISISRKVSHYYLTKNRLLLWFILVARTRRIRK